MNLKNRFQLVICSMVVLLVSVAGVVAIGIWQTNLHNQESIGMDELVIHLYELRILNKEYLAAPSERIQQQWRNKYGLISNTLHKQENMPPDINVALDRLLQIFNRFITLPDVTAKGNNTSQRRLQNQLAATLNLESQRIIDWASGISRQTKEALVQRLILIGAVMLMLILSVAVATIAIMLITTRRILSSVNLLKEGAEEIANGRLGFQIEQSGNDEIATLATAINRMSRALMGSYENLQEQTTRLETEMAERQMIHEDLQKKTVELKEEIEERKRAEAALRESEARFRAIFMQAAVGVAEIEIPTGRFLTVNRCLCEMVGRSEEEMLAISFPSITHPDDLHRHEEKTGLLMAGKIRSYDLEKRYIRKDGAIIWVNLTSSPLWQPGETPTRNLIVVQDVTDRKRTEEEKQGLQERLQRAEKMEALGTLAGGVAHDMNNVLGVLTGYSELLQERIPAGNPLLPYVNNIFSASEKGAAIIQDLLTLARRGVKTADVSNLNAIIAEFLKSPLYEKIRLHHPQVRFTTELSADLLNIKGSSVHLEKTLMNLMANAAEAITGAGLVVIRTENRYLDKPVHGYEQIREGDYVLLAVSDTGGGIPSADLEKIFEPFYTRKKMGRSGTGLGLAIVWGTVKDHEGYIDVESTAGRGSTFMLYFPVTRESFPVEQSRVPVERYLGGGETILVVDDVEEQRSVAVSILSRLGYHAHEVSSGEEAVAYLRTGDADLVMLDMIMEPGMDGLETYRQILTFKPAQRAIIVSGFSETDRVRDVQRLGAGAYVKKPYMIETIGVAIRDELSKGRGGNVC